MIKFYLLCSIGMGTGARSGHRCEFDNVTSKRAGEMSQPLCLEWADSRDDGCVKEKNII